MMLDDMHLRKIDMADEIYVINRGGYIGGKHQARNRICLDAGKEGELHGKGALRRERPGLKTIFLLQSKDYRYAV